MLFVCYAFVICRFQIFQFSKGTWNDMDKDDTVQKFCVRDSSINIKPKIYLTYIFEVFWIVWCISCFKNNNFLSFWKQLKTISNLNKKNTNLKIPLPQDVDIFLSVDRCTYACCYLSSPAKIFSSSQIWCPIIVLYPQVLSYRGIKYYWQSPVFVLFTHTSQ